MTIFDRGTMEEKKAILENEAKLRPGDRPPTTYAALSEWPEPGLPAPEASPLHYPAQPTSSPWGSPIGPGTEPPLGYAIDDVEPCGTPAEIAKSLRERN
jgi:hypothetical protein